MSNRVIDLSEEPAKLYVRNFILHIERDGSEIVKVPLPDLAVVVVSNPRVSFTQSVLAGLSIAGGVFITCDEKHMPVGILLPIAANYAQTERFNMQVSAELPRKKRVWKQIIEAKLKAQAKVLSELRGDDFGLIDLSKKVLSGDSTNIEARAARIYWRYLFDDPKFKRDYKEEDQNRFLNYGYAVLRAIVARAICAAGLHPSVGIHHHNRYDAFCLASDLMEPFRPLVDRKVCEITEIYGEDAPMDKEVKGELLSIFLLKYQINDEFRSLFEIASITASSLCAVFAKKKEEITLPNL